MVYLKNELNEMNEFEECQNQTKQKLNHQKNQEIAKEPDSVFKVNCPLRKNF